MKKYPFKDGDDYFTIENGEIVRSCWDDISEELYDENPKRLLFATKEKAQEYIKTKQLTEYQKEFIIETFFKNEDFAGWRSIASTLLDNETCVVAGTDCIWKGGIGNFIKTRKSDHFIGCLEYSFDLLVFLSSEYFKELRENHLINLTFEQKALNLKISQIQIW